MSFGTHRIRVSEREDHDTLDLNIMGNDLYHFDFDGDEMNSLVCNHIQSLIEMKNLSAPANRIISYINGKLLIGQKQDSVVGGFLLTRDEISVDPMFTIRFHSNTSLSMDLWKFGEKAISGKQALSLNLPLISYTGKSAYYDPLLKKYLQYKPSDE
jgi:DNA-directed RNA polymerase beta' subunit